MSDSLGPHELQHARLPWPSPSPEVCPDSCPLSQWCHPTISSSVVTFFSCLLSFPASGSFPVSWLFVSGGQSIGASASVLPVNIQGWFPLGLTGTIKWFTIFKRYTPFIVTMKHWPYSPCCTCILVAYFIQKSLYLSFPSPCIVPPPTVSVCICLTYFT